MIFVTVGTQGPFDRLIKTVDQVVSQCDESVIAQVFKGGDYKAKNMKTLELLSINEFNSNIAQARFVVSHAGIGTIISARELNKPILIFPRLSKFREQRNDHQWITAKKFEKLNYVYTAYNEEELEEKLKALLNGDLKPLHQLSKYASDDLIQSIKRDIKSP